MSLFTRRRAGLALGIALFTGIAAAQQQPPPQPTPGSGTAPGGRTTPTPTPTPGSIPNQQQQQGLEQPMEQMPVFLSGRVMLEDGTPPGDQTVIERVCNGTARPEAYTDTKGRFSFRVGENNGVFQDASIGGANDPYADPSRGTASSRRGAALGSQSMGTQGRGLMGCELRASLPGYRSDVVDLMGHRALDHPDVGVIILHRLANVQGSTISVSSMLAPKEAQKAYGKGAEALQKSNWSEAQKQLEKAVGIYPQYAAAWSDLGRAYQSQNNAVEASKAFDKALEADPKFLKPYLHRAALALNEKNWSEAARISERLIELDPVDYPSAYLFDALALLNLRNLDAAEKSAREGLKLDTAHRLPRLEHVLGIVLANKHDYAGAAGHLRSYLDLAPQASDADTVRKQLVEIERRIVQSSAGSPADPPRN